MSDRSRPRRRAARKAWACLIGASAICLLPRGATAAPDGGRPAATGRPITLVRTGSGAVSPGAPVTGVINSVDVYATVSSRCLAHGDFGLDDADPTAEGLQFTLFVRRDAPEGECLATFSVDPDGEPSIQRFELRLDVRAGLESLDLGPDGPRHVVLADDHMAADADDVTLTATRLSDWREYRVSLIDTENITISPDGVTTFLEDVDPLHPGVAAVGSGRATITTANGVPVPHGTDRTLFHGRPVDGVLTVVVDGTGVGSVTPVIYPLGGDVDRLELDQGGRPAERFGLAGAVHFVASSK